MKEKRKKENEDKGHGSEPWFSAHCLVSTKQSTHCAAGVNRRDKTRQDETRQDKTRHTLTVRRLQEWAPEISTGSSQRLLNVHSSRDSDSQLWLIQFAPPCHTRARLAPETSIGSSQRLLNVHSSRNSDSQLWLTQFTPPCHTRARLAPETSIRSSQRLLNVHSSRNERYTSQP